MMGHRWIAAAALVAVGCVESPREAPPAERAPAASQAPGPAAGGWAGAASSEAPAGPDACEDLTEAMLRLAVALPETVAVTQARRGGSTSRSCEYTWTDPAVDPEARRRAAVAQAAQAAREGRGAEAAAELAQAVGPASVRYIETPPEASPEAARSKFEGMMQRLNEGVTHELQVGPGRGTTFTLQSTTESVEGVGDAAHWSASMHQLFVLSGPRFFQVVVRARPEPAGDLELAKAIASAIVAAEPGAGASPPASPEPSASERGAGASAPTSGEPSDERGGPPSAPRAPTTSPRVVR